MDKMYITDTVVKAITPAPFLGQKENTMRQCVPYWIQLKDGIMWFEFTGPHTNPHILRQQIAEGKIYVRECDFKGPAF